MGTLIDIDKVLLLNEERGSSISETELKRILRISGLSKRKFYSNLANALRMNAKRIARECKMSSKKQFSTSTISND